MDAVVLLSGGIDSAVASYIARVDIGGGTLYGLNVYYGQVHMREVASAQSIANDLGIDLKRVRVPLALLASSSLVGKGEIPSAEEPGIPSTWVPQRNSIFLSLAFCYAESIGADLVYIGVNSVDYSGYPDCRPEFIQATNTALNLASKKFVETGSGIQIVAPLQYLRKLDIIKMGLKLGVDLSHTWSCYRGKEEACGRCPSCLIRLKAFLDLGVGDPVKYEK